MNASNILNTLQEKNRASLSLEGLPNRETGSYSLSISRLNDGKYNVQLPHRVIGRDSFGGITQPEWIPLLERFNAKEVWAAHWQFNDSSALERFTKYILPHIKEIR